MLIPLDFGENRPALLAEIADIFTAWRPEWKWSRKRHLYGVEYVWVLETVRNLIGDFDKKRILDAGGGIGALQYLMALRGAEVVNVSLGGGGRIHGTTNSGVEVPRVMIIGGDMETVDLPKESLDAVVSVSSIEHNPWEKILNIIRNLVTLLKPGAPLVFTVPAGWEEGWFPRGEFPGRPNFPDTYLFDRESFQGIKNILKPHGIVNTWIPDMSAYKIMWDTMKQEMEEFPGGHVCPYLAAGFVFVKHE